jgi:hypothetical protein
VARIGGDYNSPHKVLYDKRFAERLSTIMKWDDEVRVVMADDEDDAKDYFSKRSFYLVRQQKQKAIHQRKPQEFLAAVFLAATVADLDTYCEQIIDGTKITPTNTHG